MVTFNYTCNATLEDLRIVNESPIAGELNFHELGFIVAAACTLIAVVISCYSMWMHAVNYTKPYEQRHVLRILFMVPIYAIASLLSFAYYWHSIYFDVLSNCYEAFAIASFFALLCHYVAPNLHDQKNYFRNLQDILPWVMPLNWFNKCTGGPQKGPFRTPRSGLTWFNVIWSSIYQYCFVRVIMTITAVLTQYYGKYCQSSDNPIFAHIWVLVINSVAVSFAMYGVIQFYYQLRKDLAHHSPLLKVVAIKLVIFLSFWQTSAISVMTGAGWLSASDKLAYPDIAVGIPSLLICVEMALFSILHIFAYPHKPYTQNRRIQYPSSGDHIYDVSMNELGENKGGRFGIKAFFDAMNPWDLVKAFARGMRWLFVGVKKREMDPSYQKSHSIEMSLEPRSDTVYKGAVPKPAPILVRNDSTIPPTPYISDEGAGLIAHAQSEPMIHSPSIGTPSLTPAGSPGNYVPARLRYDARTGEEYDSINIDQPHEGNLTPGNAYDIGLAISPVGTSAHPQQPHRITDNRIQAQAHSLMWGDPQQPQQEQQGRPQPQSTRHVDNYASDQDVFRGQYR